MVDESMSDEQPETARDKQAGLHGKLTRLYHRLGGNALTVSLIAVALSFAGSVGLHELAFSANNKAAVKHEALLEDLNQQHRIEQLFATLDGTGNLAPYAKKRLCQYWTDRKMNAGALLMLDTWGDQETVVDKGEKMHPCGGGAVFDALIKEAVEIDKAKDKAISEADKSDLTARATHLRQCAAKADLVNRACEAHDKSGFHGKPRASCTITAEPPDGMVLRGIEIKDEYSRNPDGKSAPEQLAELAADMSALEKGLSLTAACTNDRGTGRTCAARVAITATAIPENCAEDYPHILAP